jgi:hypothetical protein
MDMVLDAVWNKIFKGKVNAKDKDQWGKQLEGVKPLLKM